MTSKVLSFVDTTVYEFDDTSKNLELNTKQVIVENDQVKSLVIYKKKYILFKLVIFIKKLLDFIHIYILDEISVKIFAGIKFMFDRIVATLGLLLTSPIMLIIAILIKLDSKGPVFFRQERTGKDGKIFKICKFRTMTVNNNVYDFEKKDQVTRVGKILRRLSLDEIPQLFAIAIGKMSFIGPRPWIPEYYENMDERQKRRCSVRPGLTGLAQVMGRNTISIFDKIEYDLKYIENYSLIQEIKIVFLTIKTIFTGKGVDAGKATIRNELNDLKNQKIQNIEMKTI